MSTLRFYALDLLGSPVDTGCMTSWFSNPDASRWSSGAGVVTRDFHRALPGYAQTPLVLTDASVEDVGVMVGEDVVGV